MIQLLRDIYKKLAKPIIRSNSGISGNSGVAFREEMYGRVNVH